MPSVFPESETKVVVSQLKKARRRHLTLAWVVLGFFGGLLAWWASNTVKHLPDKPEQTMAKLPEKAAAAAPLARTFSPPPRPARPAAPTRSEARVWVFASRGAKVAVDGKPLAKNSSRDRADLAPGAHIVSAELGKNKVSHQVQVEAGDELLIEFDDQTGAVDVRRLAPPGS